MNEAETRAGLIDPALKAVGWGAGMLQLKPTASYG